MFLKRYIRQFEGFENTPASITERIRAASNTDDKESAVAKSYHMEGFEDVSNDKDSVPAPTVTKGEVDSKAVAEVTSAVKKEDEKKNDAVAKEEFQSATNELFKLGKMPSEHKEGPMLDAGGTLMKAMSSFDPDTTQKMTQDTKQLLETQKSLMNMLTQMRPILADGKELLQTFSGMFGGSGGVTAGQFALAK
jgi:hypothetical protein